MNRLIAVLCELCQVGDGQNRKIANFGLNSKFTGFCVNLQTSGLGTLDRRYAPGLLGGFSLLWVNFQSPTVQITTGRLANFWFNSIPSTVALLRLKHMEADWSCY